MSFGFGVGDFLAVGNLCWKVYKKFKDAPGNYTELSGEVSALYAVIKETGEMLSQQNLTAKQQAGLVTCREGCEDVLQDFNDLLIKYESLGTQSQRTFDRMGFGSQDMKDIRLRLISNVSMLDAFNNAHVDSSHASLEKKLNFLIKEVRAGKREGSVISVRTIDTVARKNREIWEELRRELEDVGISADIINEKRQFIIAWFLEAVAAGKLEEDVPSEEEENAVSLLPGNHRHAIEADDGLIHTSRSRSLDETGRSHSGPLALSSEDVEGPLYMSEALANTKKAGAAPSSEGSIKRRPEKEHEITRGQPNKSQAAGLQKPRISRLNLTYLLGTLQGKSREEIEAEQANKNFMQAILAHDVSLACYYIAIGADIDTKGEGFTALSRAADIGDVPMTRLLLEKGANANLRNNVIEPPWVSGGSALVVAVRNDSYEVVKLLLGWGADVNMTNSQGRHALMIAVARPWENMNMVKLLLSHGANVNLRDSFGCTALSEAALCRKLSTVTVKLLLQNGARADLGIYDHAAKMVVKRAQDELYSNSNTEK